MKRDFFVSCIRFHILIVRLRNGAFVPSAFHRIQKRNLKGFCCLYHHVTLVDCDKTLTLVWEAMWLTALSTLLHLPVEHHICLFDSWSIFSHKMAAGLNVTSIISSNLRPRTKAGLDSERGKGSLYKTRRQLLERNYDGVCFTQFLSHSVVSHWFHFKCYAFSPLLFFFLLVQLIEYGTNHAKIVGSTPREEMYILNSL